MTPDAQRSPVGATVLDDLLGSWITAENTTTGETTPGASRAKLYRVRWWRPGWQGGPDSANVRYYSRGSAAHRFADKLRTSPPNEHGPIRVQVWWCSRSTWQVEP
jgi:hypothetical protein